MKAIGWIQEPEPLGLGGPRSRVPGRPETSAKPAII